MRLSLALPSGFFAPGRLAALAALTALVVLVGAGCGGGGGAVSVIPTAPSVPASLKAVPGNSQVTLTWDLSPGATLYNVYRDDAPGTGHLLKGGLAQTTYTDTGLTNGQPYTYEVTAQNVSGESAKAAPVSTTLPVAFTLTLGPPSANLDNGKMQTFTAPVAGDGTDPAKVVFQLQNAAGQPVTDGSAGTLGAATLPGGVPTVVYTAPSPDTPQTFFLAATYPGQTAQKAVLTVGAGSGSVVIPVQ